ncbi:MAG: SRPBCC family protein [Candidatus Obscuribacterales bacterium]|jgi:uncharacterized protein YndB with AHSA1/START domain|nr:SRPBCC family protein [Candidatus Obscuribacterales bacterium]
MRSILLTTLITTTVALTTVTSGLASDGHKSKSHAPEVKLSIIVKARPEVVWEAIQHERKADADHRKLLSYDGNKAVIEEQFAAIPVVGAASCVYTESEVPIQRINYSLVHSNHFHIFQGSWVLTPAKDGKHTIVELTNTIDPGIRIPFWHEITKLAATKHVKKRLEEVAHYAEHQTTPKISFQQ